jgi:hypothetical protein
MKRQSLMAYEDLLEAGQDPASAAQLSGCKKNLPKLSMGWISLTLGVGLPTLFLVLRLLNTRAVRWILNRSLKLEGLTNEKVGIKNRRGQAGV